MNQWDFNKYAGLRTVTNELRSQAAVPEKWRNEKLKIWVSNSLQYVCEAHLKSPLIAYEGIVGPQTVFKKEFQSDRMKSFNFKLGGTKQLVIPRFSRENLSVDVKDSLIFKILRTEESSWFKKFAFRFLNREH